MASINFFTENINYNIRDKKKIRELLFFVIKKEKKKFFEEVNIILTDDETLLKINIDFLNHDSYTDTITFSYNENPNEIFGDIYISLDRVRENAKTYKTAVQKELVRIMIHGTLHLCGYEDKTENSISDKMIFLQEKYLESYK
ncbi:rRNA maturation RNase YbeY [Bacteroidales bacterium OttesenSCG-928-K03]|nr:rRNA maturation RNase YbeY [Bacteroidales bacterium OttesenSCG-928-L14]MDL2241097.1 rRNA maturation RNase YbeY [Bacteroidales bacterium OttesenSCG-928-K22]MDL2242862.1 rRNA maturation RNase YbeY [Bacteroidales bacterium OttesenSCG-928-K03]